VSKADAVAAILWTGITLYAVFGGADFGAGMWDLLAGSGKRADRARALIDHSIAPVWEANHVWLICGLVIAWTGFPAAFAAVMSTLYVPLALAALGIVLRGSGFAFRHAIEGGLADQATRVFGLASLLTPFFLGTVVGAVASGEVPADGNGPPFSSWIGLLPIVTGALFVVSAAYLSAVFLVHDAGSAGDGELREYFARRALGAAVLAGIVAVAGVVALHRDARFVYDGLVGPGLPLVILSGVCGSAALVQLVRRRTRGLRPAAVGAVVAVIWGWFVAQHPFLIPGQLTIGEAAGATLGAVIVVFGAAVVLVLPSLGLLYALSQRDALE
jgi:cytochrome bd ubiquinol oxidase subunit II